MAIFRWIQFSVKTESTNFDSTAGLRLVVHFDRIGAQIAIIDSAAELRLGMRPYRYIDRLRRAHSAIWPHRREDHLRRSPGRANLRHGDSAGGAV